MGQACGRKALSEESYSVEIATAVDKTGDDAKRMAANSARGKASVQTEQDCKTRLAQREDGREEDGLSAGKEEGRKEGLAVQTLEGRETAVVENSTRPSRSEDGREEDESSARREEDRQGALTVQTREGRQAAVVKNSRQQERPKGLLREPLAVVALSEKPSSAEIATAVELDGGDMERMAANSATRDRLWAEMVEEFKAHFAQSEDGLEEEKLSVETKEDGLEEDKSSARREEDRQGALVVQTREGRQAAVVKNSRQQERPKGLLREPLAVVALSEKPSSAEIATAVELDGGDMERMAANSATRDRLWAEMVEELKAHFAQSEDGLEEEKISAETKEDGLEEDKSSAETKEDRTTHFVHSEGGREEDKSSAETEQDCKTHFVQSAGGHEEEKSSAEKEDDREEALGVQTHDGREAAVMENSRQRKQPKDLLHGPLAVIDMPRLLSGEIEVFVLSSTTDWVMIAIPPTGSVVDLKRAIKDAKDEAYHYKFGELVGYYPYFSSGNLELCGKTLDSTYSLKQGDVLVEEKIRNSFILRGKCRRLEKCGGGGACGGRCGDEVSDDDNGCDTVRRDDCVVDGGLDLGSVRLREHLSATPTEHRGSYRMSSVDMRQIQESRTLYWKRKKGRGIMFVNRTEKLVYVFIFPGQERHRELAAINAAAPAPVGSVDSGATIRASREAHSDALTPATITLRGVPTSSAAPSSNPAAVLPPFEVFNIWKNTGRRVHYMVATLEGDDVLVWKRGDAEGGKQVHIQPPMFSPEALPVFRKECRTADGEDALSVVMSNFL